MQINLTPDPSLLAIAAIFILNYFVVRNFLIRPINYVMEQREQERETAARMHEQALARMSEATAQMEAQLHAAKKEAAQRRESYRAEAAAHRAQLVEKTQAEAKRIVSVADQRLSADVRQARETITKESENLARAAAERILGRAV